MPGPFIASTPFVILDDLPPEHDQVQCQLNTEKTVEEGEICSDDDEQSKDSTRSRNHGNKPREWDFSDRKDEESFDVEDGAANITYISDDDDTLNKSDKHPHEERENICHDESQYNGEDTSEGCDSEEMQPTIVPRRRGFWAHDNRFPDISVETSHHRTKRWKQPRKQPRKWENDCYDEIKQAPKVNWELEISSKQVKKWRKYRGRGTQEIAQNCAEGGSKDDHKSKKVNERGIEDKGEKVSERGIEGNFLEEGEICSDDEENSIYNERKRKLDQHPNDMSSDKCTDDGNNNIEKRSNWSSQRPFNKEYRMGHSKDDQFTFSHNPNWTYFRLRASAQSYE